MSAGAPDPAERSPLLEQTDERTARADWRSSVVGTLLVSALIGVWLIVSTAVLDYETPLNAVIWGVLVIFLSLLRLLFAAHSRTLALVTAIAGALTIASPFVADEPRGPTVNLVVLGGAVALLALIGLGVGAEAEERSRG